MRCNQFFYTLYNDFDLKKYNAFCVNIFSSHETQPNDYIISKNNRIKQGTNQNVIFCVYINYLESIV